jgi:ABC-2 type transport system ATP-binding protein
VREVTVTLADESAPAVALSATVLTQRRRGRQWQAMVRDATPESLAALGGVSGVQAVEVRNPSLEEIFVAYMQIGREAKVEQASTEAKSS